MQICQNKQHHCVCRQKIHNPDIFEIYFRISGVAERGQNVNLVRQGLGRGQKTVFGLLITTPILEMIWNTSWLCILLRWIEWCQLFRSFCRNEGVIGDFHLLGWSQTTRKGGKSSISLSFLHIDRNKWYHSIQRNKIHNPDIFQIILG